SQPTAGQLANELGGLIAGEILVGNKAARAGPGAHRGFGGKRGLGRLSECLQGGAAGLRYWPGPAGGEATRAKAEHRQSAARLTNAPHDACPERLRLRAGR